MLVCVCMCLYNHKLRCKFLDNYDYICVHVFSISVHLILSSVVQGLILGWPELF